MKARIYILVLAMLATAAFSSARGEASPSAAEARKSGEVKTVVLPGGAEMELIWCAPGSFEMGSPATELGRFDG